MSNVTCRRDRTPGRGKHHRATDVKLGNGQVALSSGISGEQRGGEMKGNGGPGAKRGWFWGDGAHGTRMQSGLKTIGKVSFLNLGGGCGNADFIFIVFKIKYPHVITFSISGT